MIDLRNSMTGEECPRWYRLRRRGHGPRAHAARDDRERPACGGLRGKQRGGRAAVSPRIRMQDPKTDELIDWEHKQDTLVWLDLRKGVAN